MAMPLSPTVVLERRTQQIHSSGINTVHPKSSGLQPAIITHTMAIMAMANTWVRSGTKSWVLPLGAAVVVAASVAAGLAEEVFLALSAELSAGTGSVMGTNAN